MRVAISGGTGLIGRALAARLLERGHTVVALSRRPEAALDLAPAVESSLWDCRTEGQLVPVLDGADAFVHLAGENIGGGRWTERRKRSIRSSRVESTSAVARAFSMSQSPPAVLLQGSAVGFYGRRGDEAIDETADPGEDFLAKVCREWEEAGEAVTEFGVRRVVARTGVVLDSDGGALPRMLLPFKLFAGGPVGGGKQVLSWIHLADEVGAMVHLLEHPDAGGVFNLTAPQAVTNQELALAIGRALRRPAFVPTPAFVLKAVLGEMSTLVLDGQRVRPVRLFESGYEFRFSEIGPALADLLARG